jgi:2,3-dimethylmalate lyase
MTKAAKLRELIKQKTVVIPLAMNAFHAKIVQLVGFEVVYMTGYGVSAERGYPDVGLITQTEMVEAAKYIVNAVELPVICDADTGYGNVVNVWRTVKEFEGIGASGIHIEDQVFPKKCGFYEGKKVIPMEEHVQKIRAAIDARKDSDFLIIARCDALSVNGWDDTIQRCRAYYDAGADMIFVDGIGTIEDFRIYARELSKIPRLFNCELRFTTSLEEVTRMGFKIMLVSAPVLAVFKYVKEVCEELKEKGMVSSDLTSVRPEMNNMLGLADIYKIESQYCSKTLPK